MFYTSPAIYLLHALNSHFHALIIDSYSLRITDLSCTKKKNCLIFDTWLRNIYNFRDVGSVPYTYTSIDYREVKWWLCSEKSPLNTINRVIADKHGTINSVGIHYMGVYAALCLVSDIFQFTSVALHWEFQVCYQLNCFPPKKICWNPDS